jgi:hypothetical protein
MATVRYGDVVHTDEILEGDTLEDRLRKRRASKGKLQTPEELSEEQQTDTNIEHESK